MNKWAVLDIQEPIITACDFQYKELSRIWKILFSVYSNQSSLKKKNEWFFFKIRSKVYFVLEGILVLRIKDRMFPSLSLKFLL